MSAAPGRVERPEKLARAGELRCAARDPATGAVWLGAAHGALVWYPATGQWRHARLQDETVVACGAGTGGVWLASEDHLMQPEAGGAGVRRYRLAEAAGGAVRVTGLAGDRGGMWLAVRGRDGQLPALLRLPHRPPVFQRFQPRFTKAGGPVEAIAGDGERAWALGSRWVLELDERAVTRAAPGATLAREEPPRDPPEREGAPSSRAAELVSVLSALSERRWLRAHPRGLVGRNEEGLFATPYGGVPVCPALPGRLDLLATDWLGGAGAMWVATPVGVFAPGARGLKVLAPGEDVIALLEGDPPLAVTASAVYVLDARALAAAPDTALDLPGIARQLARRRANDLATDQRRLVARALGLVGRPEDLTVLLALLEDPVPDVRATACTALGRLSPPGAPDLLARMMSDPATSVQAAASQALRQLTPQRPGGYLVT